MKNNKGSLFIEYAALMLVIVATFFCIKTYVKRAYLGYCRQTTDVYGFGRQYEPNRTTITKVR